jgi:CRISPR/Cas system-associated exonuclease Cas4 (RecB family)
MSSNRKKREKPKYPVMFSQSLINDALFAEVCPKFIHYKYVLGIETDQEDEQNLMFKGRYFEWHLLGAVRGGEEPKFKPLSGGGKPKPEKDLLELVEYSKCVLKELGLDHTKGEKQLKLVSEDLQGHIDWKTSDIQKPERKALYDVKYTETQVDDRWNGWANFETKEESKIQAAQYITLHYLVHNEFLPFYFIIFGKSKWVRVIKVELTREGLEWHELKLNRVKEKVKGWLENEWKAEPEFNKCVKCGYYSFCKDKATKPTVETFTV